MITTHKWTSQNYCSEPLSHVENYDKAMADKTHTWDLHHRLEIETLPDGQVVLRTAKELEEMGRYWHVPASELIFLPRGEHIRLHCRNRPLELRKRIAESLRGRKASESARLKMSASKMGHAVSRKTRLKMSKSHKGKKFSDEHIRKMFIPVKMRRVSDGMTMVFQSLKEAASWLRENGFPDAASGNISTCCKGKARSAYGAHWSYT